MESFVKLYVQQTLDFIYYNCEQTVEVPEICRVISLCKFLTIMATPEHGIVKNLKKDDEFINLTRLLFLFW